MNTVTQTQSPVDLATDIVEPARQPLAQVQAMPRHEPQQIEQSNPAGWIDAAIRSNADPERLRMLMDLWKQWKAELRYEAFAAAVAAFHAENPVVVKDKRNDQYGSWYTTLGNLVQSASPILGRHGLSVDWDSDNTAEEGWITINCTLQHAAGHKRTTSIRLPEDRSGKKNPLQEIKSAITYGRGLTYESVLGLAASDEVNVDDDANGAAPPRNSQGGNEPRVKKSASGIDIDGLLDAGRAKAMEGTAPLTKWWSMLSNDQRAAIMPEYGQLKKGARIVDEEGKANGGAQ